MPVVSAVPEHLDELVRSMLRAREALAPHADRLSAAEVAYDRACSAEWMPGAAPDLAGRVRRVVAQLAVLADDVGCTAAAVRAAHQTPGPADPVLVEQSTLDAARSGAPVAVEVLDALRATQPGDETARFWGGLTHEQRARLTRAAPEIVGNTDGIPFPDRCAANRVLVERALAAERAGPIPIRRRWTG